MTVRLAVIDDYSAVMHLYNDFVGDNRYDKPGNDNFTEVIGSTNSHILLAENESGLVGYLSFHKRPVIRYPQPIIEIDELFVISSVRRHGVARELFEYLEQWGRENSCFRIYVESAYKHKSAHEFYDSVGLQNYGYHFKKDLH